MDVMDRMATLWLPWILWTSLQTLLLAGLVGLLNQGLPRLSAATRCTLWWLVGLQVLVSLGWRLGLTWPWPARERLLARLATPTPVVPWPIFGLPSAGRLSILDTTIDDFHGLRWTFLAWLILVVLHVLISLTQAWQARALRRGSRPLEQELVQTLANIQARTMGLRRMPELRLAPTLDSPVVSGLWRPMILLPGARPLLPAEAAMAIAHELAHLKRADLWLGWIPALAQHLLCFHPALLWSNREYRLQRETACDTLAMRHSREDLREYGRLLLRFGTSHRCASQLASAAAGRRDLRRRLQALQRNQSQRPERQWQAKAALLLGLLGVLPYRLSLADNPSQGLVVSPPVMAPIIVTPPPPVIPPPTVISPQTAPVIAVPPPPPVAPANATFRVIGGSEPPPTTAWAVFDGQTLYFQGGASDQSRFVASQHGQQPMLWYRRGQQVYLSHDRQLIQRVIQTMQSATPISVHRATLANGQQNLLDQQWQNAIAQSDLAARQADLAASQAKAHQQWISRLWQSRLGLAPSPVASIASQPRPSSAPAELGKMDALRQQQQQLQQQMNGLVRQQQAFAIRPRTGTAQGHQQARLQKLLDEAVQQGRASPVGH